jgi:hypothetical protein
MIKLKEDVYVYPKEICSIQHETLWRKVGSISEFVSQKYFDGSIVTLKNGRKISINDLKPDEIFKMIELAKPEEGEGTGLSSDYYEKGFADSGGQGSKERDEAVKSDFKAGAKAGIRLEKKRFEKIVEAVEDLKQQFDRFSRQQWSTITQIPVDDNEFPRQEFIDFDECFKALAELAGEGVSNEPE